MKSWPFALLHVCLHSCSSWLQKQKKKKRFKIIKRTITAGYAHVANVVLCGKKLRREKKKRDAFEKTRNFETYRPFSALFNTCIFWDLGDFHKRVIELKCLFPFCPLFTEVWCWICVCFLLFWWERSIEGRAESDTKVQLLRCESAVGSRLKLERNRDQTRIKLGLN